VHRRARVAKRSNSVSLSRYCTRQIHSPSTALFGTSPRVEHLALDIFPSLPFQTSVVPFATLHHSRFLVEDAFGCGRRRHFFPSRRDRRLRGSPVRHPAISPPVKAKLHDRQEHVRRSFQTRNIDASASNTRRAESLLHRSILV
jgi:hypothetical protein